MNKWNRFIRWVESKLDDRTVVILHASHLLSIGVSVTIDIRTTAGYRIADAQLIDITAVYVAFKEKDKDAITRIHFNFIKRITIVEAIEKEASNTLPV